MLTVLSGAVGVVVLHAVTLLVDVIPGLVEVLLEVLHVGLRIMKDPKSASFNPTENLPLFQLLPLTEVFLSAAVRSVPINTRLYLDPTAVQNLSGHNTAELKLQVCFCRR